MPNHRATTIGLIFTAVAVAAAGTATAVTASDGGHTALHASSEAARSKASRGLSDVYERSIRPTKSGGVTVRIPAHRQKPLPMKLKVPAGKYVVSLTGQFLGGSKTSDLYCSVAFREKTTTTFGGGLGVLLFPASYQSASEQDVKTLKTPTKIVAYCGTNAGNSDGTSGIFTANLTALTVGAVHH